MRILKNRLFFLILFFIFIALKLSFSFNQKLDKDDVHLKEAKILSEVLFTIREQYVDLERVDPLKMLKGACLSLEKNIPEIQYSIQDSGKKPSSLNIKVDEFEKVLPLKQKLTLTDLLDLMKTIFKFIEENYNGNSSFKDIEYSAINGILETLDPHSRLLAPEVYNEFKVTTDGKFGGLGIVVGIRDGDLTVIAPLEGTPAYRAGIKPKDKIIKIDDESTINMSLTEAVNKLRGEKGTKVTITILRKGLDEPKDFTLIREDIEIKSVESELLPSNIGYFQIKNFQNNTFKDLEEHLFNLKNKAGGELQGFIIDLRNNPGGLLDQAVKVVDKFVKEGTIVTTVGMGNKYRKVEEAHLEEEKELPLAVLVNGGSASASEIVAGAIKNLNRGVVIGGNTFGKGTVQTIYPLSDGSALKLTVAKYLTPGDISIQSSGITPDIKLVPIRIKKDKIDFSTGDEYIKESDLEEHFEDIEPKIQEKPSYIIKYLNLNKKDLLSEEDEEENESSGEELEETTYEKIDVTNDFEIQFAEKFLSRIKSSNRKELLDNSKVFLNEIETEEELKIEKAFSELGIDWSKGDNKEPTQIEVTLTQDKDPATAGEEVKLTLTVTNTGTKPLHQLIGIIDAKDFILDGKEFFIGKLPPKKKKSYTISLKIPKDTLTQSIEFTVKFKELNHIEIPDFKAKLNVKELPKPKFAYSYQVIDDGFCSSNGNGDGLIQKGEDICLSITIKNIGEGASEKTYLYLKNLYGKGIFIKKGRVEIKNISPGETKEGELLFSVFPSLGENIPNNKYPIKVEMEFTIIDLQFKEYISNKIDFNIEEGVSYTFFKDFKNVLIDKEKEVLFYGGASLNSPVIAHTKGKVLLQSDLSILGWYRVLLSPNRHGWVQEKDVKIVEDGILDSTNIEFIIQKLPPSIEISQKFYKPNDKKNYVVKGIVKKGNKKVKDTYIFVNNDKVFFKSTNTLKEIPNLDFTATFPLKEKYNLVTIVARDEENIISKESFVVPSE